MHRPDNDNDDDPDPVVIESCTDLIDLIQVMQIRGISEPDIAAILVSQAVAMLVTVGGMLSGEALGFVGRVTAEAASVAIDAIGGRMDGGSA